MKYILLLLQLILGQALAGFGFCRWETTDDAPSNSHNLIHCEGHFTEATDLQRAVDIVSKADSQHRADTFQLQQASLDVLHKDLFKHQSSLRTIVFDKVSLKLISLPEYEHPFQTLKQNLEFLEVRDSEGVYGWDWSITPTMPRLKSIIIENSAIISISQEFGFAEDLRLIQLENARIRFVHPLTFAKHLNLTYCSLAENDIKEVKRSMFPRPARKLLNLDLSGNKVTELPKDLFVDMPALQEIRLDDNKLKAISTAIKPVWNQVQQLWLQGNQLPCGKLCWTTKEKTRPMFFDATKCIYRGNSVFLEYSNCAKNRKRLQEENWEIQIEQTTPY